MRRMRLASVFIATAALLALPGDAFALIVAPPGHPGVSEYVEVIPTSAGSAAPPGTVAGSGSSSAGPRALAHFGQGRRGDIGLAKLGKTGRAAASLAASTAPSLGGAASGGKTSSRRAGASAGSGGSVASGLSHALASSDTGGLGLLLPLLLATALVLALGLAAAGLRGRDTAAPGG